VRLLARAKTKVATSKRNPLSFLVAVRNQNFMHQNHLGFVLDVSKSDSYDLNFGLGTESEKSNPTYPSADGREGKVVSLPSFLFSLVFLLSMLSLFDPFSNRPYTLPTIPLVCRASTVSTMPVTRSAKTDPNDHRFYTGKSQIALS
jgi:hypothetical protein